MIEVLAWMFLCLLGIGISIDSIVLLVEQRAPWALGSGPRGLANVHIFIQIVNQLGLLIWLSVGAVSIAALLDTPDEAKGANPPPGTLAWNWSVFPDGSMRSIWTIYGLLIGGAFLGFFAACVLNRYWHAHRAIVAVAAEIPAPELTESV